MNARPEFGDAIAVEGERPSWLPDDASMEISAGGNWCSAGLPGETWCTDDKQWRFITAIRLEVPRYDFVYLALERGMVPWFGGDEAPGDWDGGAALFRNGEVSGFWPCGWDWRHDEADTPQAQAVELIGYTRKATSTALPLAHPAAPQGEDSEVERLREALRQIAEYSIRKSVLNRVANMRAIARAALAPAAIASGREGAE